MGSRSGLLSIFLLCALTIPLIATNAAEQNGYTTGQLLVATPEMRDPRFAETVIYMVKHDADGALGLVINRPLAKGPVEDLLKGFGMEGSEAKGEIIVHYGGPVSPRAGFFSPRGYVLPEKF